MPTMEKEMDRGQNHISVCICTYRRPEMLKRLLQALEEQETEGLFTFSIVVADNDGERSAEPLVANFAAHSALAIKYCVQPQQNISLTRNKAIENATGGYIAFIDDDEFTTKRWLLTLLKSLNEYKVDGVLGPVKPYFGEKAPKWVIKGKFYDRPSYPTGFVIDWTKGRTGNVLLKSDIFEGLEEPFSPMFHRAGDQDFFRRMIAKGHSFIWCDEAVAFEDIPPIRWTRSFMLKRALLRGTIGMQHPTTRGSRIAKALVAVPVYTIALPFSVLLGQHRFMNLLVRLCNHAATLMTLIGIKPVRNQLVTD